MAPGQQTARETRLSLPGLARRGVVGALNLIFPPLCVSCRMRVGEAHALCASCSSAIPFIEGSLCKCCGSPFDVDPGSETICGPYLTRPNDFARMRSLFRYDAASKPLILAFKHGDRLDHAPAFARWLERTGRPLFADRFRSLAGSYGSALQPTMLAEGLSKLAGVPHDPLVLEKCRATKSQGEISSAKARRRNVLNTAGKNGAVRGRNVLLIDDVFATGAC